MSSVIFAVFFSLALILFVVGFNLDCPAKAVYESNWARGAFVCAIGAFIAGAFV